VRIGGPEIGLLDPKVQINFPHMKQITSRISPPIDGDGYKAQNPKHKAQNNIKNIKYKI
jgi:hypothetical protein